MGFLNIDGLEDANSNFDILKGSYIEQVIDISQFSIN